MRVRPSGSPPCASRVLSHPQWQGLGPTKPQRRLQGPEPEHNGWEVFHQLLHVRERPARLCADAHRAARAIA
ncbi:MAG: hypothetical protein ACO3B3_05750, partial [Cyanobium sp.]